jgi:hypothetical protein
VPKKDLEGGAETIARTGSVARKGGVPEVESPKDASKKNPDIDDGGKKGYDAKDKRSGEKGTFIDDMSPAEAKRYEDYWHHNNPGNVTPGIRKTTDTTVPSSRAGEVYSRDTYYDEFGRRRASTDYTDHSMPDHHTNPHDHKYTEILQNDGTYKNVKTKNPETGTKVFNR